MRGPSRLVWGMAAVGLAVGASGAGAPRAHAAPACTAATNIEAIIDDSGSMSITDPNRLRVQALETLIDALGNGRRPADRVRLRRRVRDAADAGCGPRLQPRAGRPERRGDEVRARHGDPGRQRSDRLQRRVRHGAGGHPGAQARIFLTDGGHDVGDYANAHLNPTPPQTPTYVIGFSAGVGAPEDQARLQQIASDTGGRYFPLPDSSALQSVMDEIEATLTCQSAPKTFTDSLAQGKSTPHTVTIAPGSRSAQLALSWTSPLDQFTISGLKIVSKGKTVAVAARKVRKLKLTTKRGTTFVVVKVTHLVRGKLRFKVKAAKIGSGQPKVSLTTQVSQARH